MLNSHGKALHHGRIVRLTEHDDVIKPPLRGAPRLGLALGPAPARASPEGAILKFVNISSDAISPNEVHKVSSASNSKSISEIEEETTPGQISNNEQADVESNISKAYVAEVGNDDITILLKM